MTIVGNSVAVFPVHEQSTFLTSDVEEAYAVATIEESSKSQKALNAFAEKNLLEMNITKCEIVLFSNHWNTTLSVCEMNGSVVPTGDIGKYLGYWWRGDLLATTSVDDNIQEARYAFFHFGSIVVFQGDVSSLIVCM